MKELDPRIDENMLWQAAFPRFYERATHDGVFIMPHGDGATAEERAISRLDMTMVCLWPYVQDLFIVDFFPHRLAAATDLLRAADFGEGDDVRVNKLARELAAALDAVELVMAEEQEKEQSLRAAEEDD